MEKRSISPSEPEDDWWAPFQREREEIYMPDSFVPDRVPESPLPPPPLPPLPPKRCNFSIPALFRSGGVFISEDKCRSCASVLGKHPRSVSPRPISATCNLTIGDFFELLEFGERKSKWAKRTKEDGPLPLCPSCDLPVGDHQP
jgi:hypothetical protein